MTDGGAELPDEVAQRGRQVVLERLRVAFDHQVATRQTAVALHPARLEELITDAAQRAGGALWRRSLAQAVMEKLDVDLPEALAHPVLARAREQAGAPSYRAATATATSTEIPEQSPPPDPASQLRLGAVHLTGIETLRPGDRDLELRLSDAGLDVLKRSSGVAIGRLEWSEIDTIELPLPRRGLRGRRRFRELHVITGRGQAQFELPGLTDDELREHLEPMLARLRGAAHNNSNDAGAD